VLYKLAVRFKTLDITSVFTMEVPSLYSTERVTELGLSPIADNLLMLRYKGETDHLVPMLTIVKTRGSDHDRRTHAVTVGAGGMRVGPPTRESKGVPARQTAGAKGRPKRNPARPKRSGKRP
jgi:circadian clock protein KaiC